MEGNREILATIFFPRISDAALDQTYDRGMSGADGVRRREGKAGSPPARVGCFS